MSVLPLQTATIRIDADKTLAIEEITNPSKMIHPSFSCSPKPIVKIPIAGNVFVPGIGIIIEIDISIIIKPIKIRATVLVQI